MSSAPVFDSPAAVTDFLKLHAGQAYESFVVVFLDARHQLIVVEDVFRGTLKQTSVHPREILKRRFPGSFERHRLRSYRVDAGGGQSQRRSTIRIQRHGVFYFGFLDAI